MDKSHLSGSTRPTAIFKVKAQGFGVPTADLDEVVWDIGKQLAQQETMLQK